MRITRHIHKKIAEDSIHQPWRTLAGRHPVQKIECQFQLVHGIRARFVHARCLAGRADEDAREEI